MNEDKSKYEGVGYEGWAKLSFWTIDEALGLALGIERVHYAYLKAVEEMAYRPDIYGKLPEDVYSNLLEGFKADLTKFGIDNFDSVAEDLATLRVNVERAIAAGTLKTLNSGSDKLIPSDFVQWAVQSKMLISDELINAVKTRTGGDQTPQQQGAESTRKKAKTMRKDTEKNYHKMILGLAINAGYDPGKKKNELTGSNNNCFSEMCKVPERTVRNILKKAKDSVGAEFSTKKAKN